MTHFKCLVIGATALSFAAAPLAQIPTRDVAVKPIATGTASISGTVISNETTSRPLRRVTVTLTSAATLGISRVATTDDAGKFAFTKLPAGSYSAPRAAKGGYITATYGEKRPDGLGTPIGLAEGQQLTIAIQMLRGGVITGTLRDQSGAPMSGVGVQASSVRVANGVRQPGAVGPYQSGTSDDRGIYRIYGLAPGDYVVSASPRGLFGADLRPITDAELQWAQRQVSSAGQPGANQAGPPPRPAQAVTYTPVFYPGTTNPETASLIKVTAGDEQTGIDLGVEFVPTARIEGVVADPSGQPPLNLQLNLVSKSDGGAQYLDPFFFLDSMMTSRSPAADGKFNFTGVRPGDYTIAARAAARSGAAPTPPTGPPSRGGGPGAAPLTLWGSADVTINGTDVSGISITLQQGMTLSGRVVFSGTTLEVPADLTRASVRLASAPSPTGVTVSINVPSANVAADGTFKLEGVTPGRYFVSASVPGAGGPAGGTWVFRSATVNGIDAADVPFDVRPQQDISDAVITFTDKPAEVSGTILDAAGHPTSDFSIILFSADKTMWSQRSRRLRPPVRVSSEGKFKFTSVLPGEYYIAALTDFQPNDYNNPVFLEQVAASGAMKITVGEGEKKVQDLKVAGGS